MIAAICTLAVLRALPDLIDLVFSDPAAHKRSKRMCWPASSTSVQRSPCRWHGRFKASNNILPPTPKQASRSSTLKPAAHVMWRADCAGDNERCMQKGQQQHHWRGRCTQLGGWTCTLVVHVHLGQAKRTRTPVMCGLVPDDQPDCGCAAVGYPAHQVLSEAPLRKASIVGRKHRTDAYQKPLRS